MDCRAVNGKKILCIDDSADICELLELHLGEEGYAVETAMNAAESMATLKSFDPDLILLDVLLPDIDGLSLLKKIKDHKELPVILVSGRGEDIDKIIGIEAGADDYVTKPFNVRELLARINMVLKRYAPNAASVQDTLNDGRVRVNEDVIEFDNWVMDRKQYQVYGRNGTSANFTTNEFLLLERLASVPYQVLSREQLFDLWRDQGMNLYERAIDVQITRIRQKLDDNPKDPKYIKTIRGVGYMFTGQYKADDAE